ncbi:MAG TPA: sugar phosphate nucleotidyltransferase, partial [Bacteroidota bacterium]
MKAVIMAGGFGTRLRPLTYNIPKPMVPVMNKPMMQHIIELLRSHGIRDIVATLFYHPETITEYFGDGSRFGVRMQYARSDDDYGTAGGVRNAAALLTGRCLVISGDVLTDIDLSKAIQFHDKRKAKATIILSRSINPLQFGIVVTRDDGSVTRFLEKPSWGEVFSDTINTGIYILEPEILPLVPVRQEFDFSKNLFPLMIEGGMPLYGYVADGYWRDIGNLNEYQEAHFDCLEGRVKLAWKEQPEDSVSVGRNSVIRTEKGNLKGSILIGQNSVIEENVKISNSVIGDNCEIRRGSTIRNAVIWDRTSVGMLAELSSAVIGAECSIGDRTVVAENVFMGDKCVIGKEARLAPNIKLWPGKTVDDGAVLTRSLVWEDKWLRELFTDSRVTGLSNVEMNPEFGARLGAAFGSFVGEGKTIVTCRDPDNVSRMMNRAIMCGLMSAGVNVADLRATPVPILRHELSSGKESGGIHVRKSPYDPTLTDLIFFDSDGKDLPANKRKSVERLFYGEDFIRAQYANVGSITFPERTAESYRQRFFSRLDVDAINNAAFKVVVDYSNGMASTIFPTILGRMKCKVVALNAHLDPEVLTRGKAGFDEAVAQLSHIVTSLRYDLGFRLDSGGEKTFIVDESGKFINPHRLLTIVTKLYLDSDPDVQKIAVPINATMEVEMVAETRGVEVVRTKNSHLAMMEAAEAGIPFVGGTKGGFIFRDFLFATDGMFCVAKILELMARTKRRLGDVDRELPRLHAIRKDIECSWDAKGRVMRHLMADSEGENRLLVDGIKIFDNDPDCHTSVLLIPDKTRPLFHVYAEAEQARRAEELAGEYEQKIVFW